MNTRLTLILVLAVALLGGYVYFFELSKPATAPAVPGALPGETPIPMVATTADNLAGLEVTSPDGHVELSRPPGGNWLISQPDLGEADQVRVSSVVGRLAPLNATRVLTENVQPLAEYGLANPAVTLTLVSKDNARATVQIGDATTAGDNYYAKMSTDNTVYLIAKTPIDDAKKFVTSPPKPLPTSTPTAEASPIASPAATATP